MPQAASAGERLKGYALVTPARNERENLRRLADSVVSQTLAPIAWVIADDGSDDGSDELLAELAGSHDWIQVVETGGSGQSIARGRREGRALDAFRHGVSALAEPVEVVVKVDADTSFDPTYFETLVGHFDSQPDLGIAGGACYELEDGVWRRRRVAANHPRGASRAYRWPCLELVMTLESRMGWDGLDEVKARMHGYRSRSFVDLAFRHHRPTGDREENRFGHYVRQGEASWYMGYRPSYLLLRALYRAAREPAATGMAWGYLTAAARRAARCPEPAVVRRLRDEQRLRAVVRNGAPP